MKEELERLEMNYLQILACLLAANGVEIRNPALNEWRWQLRDVIDDTDDLLDEFEYMKHKERLAVLDPMLKKLEDVVHRLDGASVGFNTFLQLIKEAKKKQQQQERDFHRTRETGSLPNNELICRIKEKDYVIAWLRQSLNEEHQTQCNAMFDNISLQSIVGHGGMGKTTILQHVYEDKEITEEFDLKIWVWVSINSDSNKVIADMLECVYGESDHLKALNTLHEALNSAVESKKFLLVLDDIWDDEQQNKIKWEDVLTPLARGKFGSKILITTRMDSVAVKIANVINKKKETLILKGLGEDECLQLLNAHAFAGEENFDGHKMLRSITVEIVKKLSGSPLAAKVFGRALNEKMDKKYWITILESDISDTEFGQKDILPILKLSYTSLPKNLQHCFAYCCIFSQYHEFDKFDLVRMWIALGFIQSPSNSKEFMENVGGKHFDILVNNSFFKKFEDKYKIFYKMDDLPYQLAQSIFTDKCFRVEDDEELFSRIPDTVRYLVVRTCNLKMLQRITKFKNLKSLHLIYEGNDQTFTEILSEIFRASRRLRLLEIHFQHLKRVPETIECLIHLKYLKIHSSDINSLPRSLNSLHKLQFFLCLDS